MIRSRGCERVKKLLSVERELEHYNYFMQLYSTDDLINFRYQESRKPSNRLSMILRINAKMSPVFFEILGRYHTLK